MVYFHTRMPECQAGHKGNGYSIMSQVQNNDNTANIETFRVVIKNLGNKTLILHDNSRSLLHHFHSQGIDWMYACGGKGRCTTCKVIVLEGQENFELPTKAEQNYKNQGLLKNNERLACQAKIFGSIQVAVPEEGKLPHLNYSD